MTSSGLEIPKGKGRIRKMLDVSILNEKGVTLDIDMKVMMEYACTLTFPGAIHDAIGKPDRATL